MFARENVSDKRVRVPEHKKVLVVFFILFLIFSLVLFFVFGWIFLNSFKTKNEYLASIWSFPKSLNFSNFVDVIKYDGNANFFSMLTNSFTICLVLPTVNCFITSIVSYALAKFKFKGKKIVYFIHILPMMFCLSGTQASLFILLDKLRLVDSLGGLVAMNLGAGGMNFLLLYGAYKNISDTYIEAAEIDGAGDFRTYFQIMMPQALGIIGTLWMFGFIGTWNDYATINLFYFSHPTVAVGLEALRTEFTGNTKLNYPMYYAALILSLLPVIILFLLFQEQIMKLSLGGGIKG